MAYTVYLRRTETGDIRPIPWEGEWDSFLWCEHNFSCDCNRGIQFEEAGGDAGTVEDGESFCGETKFRIARVETDDGQTLYPEDAEPAK